VEQLPAAWAASAVAWTDLSLLLPLPVILAANWRERPPAGPGVAAAIARLSGQAIWFLLGAIGIAVALFGLLDLVGAAVNPQPTPRFVTFSLVLIATGVVAFLLTLRTVRARIARFMPIDAGSALDATALVLTVTVAGTQLALQLVVDQLTEQAQAGTALRPLDLLTQELPFLLAALLGVGIFIRRSPRAALERLGFVRASPWQLVIALAAAGAFYAFGNGVDALAHVLTPGLAHKVDAANQRLFGQLGDPVGIATIALSAGICEEALFRGALQPRLGLLWTALVFAAVHSQYGLSLDAAAVFVLALGLGLLRRLTNTTTSTVCHVAYNTLVGIGVGGAWLVPALALEAALVLAGLTAFLTGRVGSLRTAQ
jgi:membrane protease YdiL (CAAX protease family)